MATVHSTNPFAEGVERFCSGLILSDEKFEAMSKQAAIDLRENKAAYFQRVIAMALLGYGYIALIVAIGVGGLLYIGYFAWQSHHMNIGVVKVMIVLAIVEFGMMRALWIKYPPPEGVKVSREEAPELYSLIDKFKSELNTRVDHVLVNDEFNAFVTQIPRFGFLGFHQNYLVLGLPLMAALNADQFKGVLAHELGHLSGNHSKSSAWVYGLRARWSQLLTQMRHESPFIFAIFYVFFSWLAPRFNAYTMAMARAHELDADRDAERIAGGGHIGSALVLVRLKGRYLNDKLWAKILRLAADNEAPPRNVYSEIVGTMGGLPIESDKAKDWLLQVLAEKGSGVDTHPPLSERLSARNCLAPYENASDELMAELQKPLELGQSSAEVFLASALPSVIKNLSDSWYESVKPYWSDKHEFFKHAKERLAEFETKAKEEPLKLEEMKEKAYYISEMVGVEGCRPVLEEILTQFPGDPMANYTVGALLLDEGKDEGIELLEKAMAGRVSLISDCCERLERYFAARGRADEVKKYDGKLAEFRNEQERAQKERQGVNARDTLVPHELSVTWLEYIANVLPHFPKVQNAYLVQKQVNYFPEYPYLVLALDTKCSAEENLELARWLLANLELPDQFCVITFDGHTKSLKEMILKTDKSKIYELISIKK